MQNEIPTAVGTIEGDSVGLQLLDQHREQSRAWMLDLPCPASLVRGSGMIGVGGPSRSGNCPSRQSSRHVQIENLILTKSDILATAILPLAGSSSWPQS
jgi:hypothetical protein